MTQTAINRDIKLVNDKIKHLESIVHTAAKTGSLGMVERSRQKREEILREFSILQDERDNAVAALKKQPKLSIPKKIAELLDTSNSDWGNVEIEELDYWIFPNIPDGKESYRSALCEVYLAGEALGVELVEVEG